MNWRKDIAYGWLCLAAGVITTTLIYAIFMAIWESGERGFWFGFISFLGITAWAVYELIPPVMS